MTKTGKKTVSFRQMMGPELLSGFGGMCAWNGCRETFKGDMPGGWRWLLTYHYPQPIAAPFETALIDLDCALCPEHASELGGLLKKLPDARSRGPGGKA